MSAKVQMFDGEEWRDVPGHYVTAIGPVDGGGTAVACRCGWFAVARGGGNVMEKVRRHMEAR